jgi:predicted MFS family arabinose efflux permease
MARAAGEDRRQWALGLGTAAGSIGRFAVVPVAQVLIDTWGWIKALNVLAGTSLTMVLLYGIVFLGHQIGSFIAVWLGGWLYDASGNYKVVWWLSVVIGIIAAIVHWPINEQPVRRLAAQKV